MTVSDLLTIVGIIIAIIVFISERSREYIFLKLSRFDIILIFIAFCYIHFLLSFDWLKDKFSWLSKFEFYGWPSNETWAYIISILILIYSVGKIFWGKFPLSRKEKLIEYYNKLILKNDFAFLADLVENYHINQIVAYLQKKQTIKIKNPTGFWAIDNEEYFKEYKKVINTRKLKYGDDVFHNVILNDTFIENVSIINPILFAEVIKELNKKELKHDDFVNRFLKMLTLSKNSNFFREIRNNQNLAEFEAYAIEKERPILHSLFNDIKVCQVNQAWRGVGEQAILEMQEEAKKDFSLLRESDKEQDKDTLWSYRITNAIWYFDIMIRQSIVQGIDDHMWMFYFHHFTRTILSNMVDLPFPDSEINRYSRNYDLIEKMFSKMMDWKEVVINSKNDKLSRSIYTCIGLCIYELAINNKLRDEDKNHLINWVWENLITSYGEDERQNEIVETILNYGFEIFKKPSGLFSVDLKYRPEESKSYLKCLSYLWDKRDTPILTNNIGLRADRFKVEVIDVLL